MSGHRTQDAERCQEGVLHDYFLIRKPCLMAEFRSWCLFWVFEPQFWCWNGVRTVSGRRTQDWGGVGVRTVPVSSECAAASRAV